MYMYSVVIQLTPLIAFSVFFFIQVLQSAQSLLLSPLESIAWFTSWIYFLDRMPFFVFRLVSMFKSSDQRLSSIHCRYPYHKHFVAIVFKMRCFSTFIFFWTVSFQTCCNLNIWLILRQKFRTLNTFRTWFVE